MLKEFSTTKTALKEMMRQKESLELIASENFASKAVLSALSTHFKLKFLTINSGGSVRTHP